MSENYDDTFLARWLANELTKEELKSFQESDDYKAYALIAETTGRAQVASFDLDHNLEATLQKVRAQSKKRVIPLWSYAAAASVLLCFIAYTFLFQSTTISTTVGEQREVVLPDGSNIVLNAVSSIAFEKRTWAYKRNVQLTGEAFFAVKKGASFTVQTTEGLVTVLGTEFSVTARNNYYQVVCYQGSVKVVTQAKDSVVLLPGKSFERIANQVRSLDASDATPAWLQGESSFDRAPIAHVLEELERQYKIRIEGKENVKTSYFTGRFPHNDLDKALQIVFVTMDIKRYDKKSDGSVVILK